MVFCIEWWWLIYLDFENIVINEWAKADGYKKNQTEQCNCRMHLIPKIRFHEKVWFVPKRIDVDKVPTFWSLNHHYFYFQIIEKAIIKCFRVQWKIGRQGKPLKQKNWSHFYRISVAFLSHRWIKSCYSHTVWRRKVDISFYFFNLIFRSTFFSIKILLFYFWKPINRETIDNKSK